MTSRRRPDRGTGPAAGLLAGAAGIAACTALIYPLKQGAPAVACGVVYLLAVLAVASRFGLASALLTALGSAVAFNFFHIEPTGRLTVADEDNWVALAVFLVTAVVVSRIAGEARIRALEAEQGRRDAALAAELAEVLLGEQRLADALPVAGARLAQARGLRAVRIDPDGRIDAPGADVSGIQPAVSALLAAARHREELLDQTVETSALRRSDELKTALLRAVSHDLRTPLTAIATAGEALRSAGLRAGERAELADTITQQTERLTLMVANLLDLSRLEAGRAEPRRDWVALDEVVHAAAEGVGTEVELRLPADLPLLRADAAQLQRAFANVLDNAHRHDPGHVPQVRARASGGVLHVRVVDRGPGMPAVELERVFEPFHGAGSGLGLAIVRGFVEAHGGRVWAESLPGQGTVIAIDLPLEEHVAA
jgi:two-component system sensor histidine kinase KdpD